MTEHQRFTDCRALQDRTQGLRGSGVRLSIDHTVPGYSGVTYGRGFRGRPLPVHEVFRDGH